MLYPAELGRGPRRSSGGPSLRMPHETCWTHAFPLEPGGAPHGSRRWTILLVIAVGYELDPEIMRTLVDAGANANLGSGPTPLHYAAKPGSMDQVRFLLRSGAVVDARDGWQFTPLYYAVKDNRPEIAATLFRAGADPRVRGRTAKRRCTVPRKMVP